MFITKKLATKLREGVNLIDKEKNESLGLKENRNLTFRVKKALNNLCYNLNKTKLFDFLERITLNIGNTFSVYNKKHSWVIVNKRMNKSENDIVQSISNLHGLKVFSPRIRHKCLLRQRLESNTSSVTIKQTETNFFCYTL